MNPLEDKGYLILEQVFGDAETDVLAAVIAAADTSAPSFRKTDALFAIRRFLEAVPGVMPYLFTEKLRDVLTTYAGPGFFGTKAIYFDKPEQSNWFVAYHQDLTIAVDRKTDIEGYGPWTKKQDQFAVQPPLPLLENNITIRIHLDDTDAANGALKVIPGSHKKGIYRPEHIDWSQEQEDICCVPRGGIMLMKPLLLHASDRSAGTKRRRVIHLEFSKAVLPSGLRWSEQFLYGPAV